MEEMSQAPTEVLTETTRALLRETRETQEMPDTRETRRTTTTRV